MEDLTKQLQRVEDVEEIFWNRLEGADCDLAYWAQTNVPMLFDTIRKLRDLVPEKPTEPCNGTLVHSEFDYCPRHDR